MVSVRPVRKRMSPRARRVESKRKRIPRKRKVKPRNIRPVPIFVLSETIIIVCFEMSEFRDVVPSPESRVRSRASGRPVRAK
jgi:hypothetical protein